MDNQEGYIYVLYNKAYETYGTNVYKLGKAKDIGRRLNDYTTYYLHPMELKYISPMVKNYTLAENILFKQLKKYRLRTNREFFKIVNIEETVNIIESLIKDLNNDDINLLTYTEMITEEKNERIKEKNERIKEVRHTYNESVNGWIHKMVVHTGSRRDTIKLKQLYEMYTDTFGGQSAFTYNSFVQKMNELFTHRVSKDKNKVHVLRCYKLIQ